MRRTTSKGIRLTSTHNYLFLSDLHLSTGRNQRTGKLNRCETFQFDDAFADLLVYHVTLGQRKSIEPAYQKPWKLYLNGDTFELLELSETPAEDDPIYRDLDQKHKTEAKTYGLGTSPAEAIWKIQQIAAGHPVFFQALGWFLAQPNHEIVFLKGNRDIEIVWEAVQNCLVDLIGGYYHAWYRDQLDGRTPESPLPFDVKLPRTLGAELRSKVRFPAWFDYEKGLFYIEHGNQYDPLHTFSDFIYPVKPGTANRLELPFGSLLQRYVIHPLGIDQPNPKTTRPFAQFVQLAATDNLTDVTYNLLRNPSRTVRSLSDLWQARPFSRQTAPLDSETAAYFPLPYAQLRQIEQVKKKFTSRARRHNRQSYSELSVAILLKLTFWLLLVTALSGLIRANWTVLLASLVLAGVCYFTRMRIIANQKVNLSRDHLRNVSKDMCKILNAQFRGESAAVQFHIFAHDHHPDFDEIAEHKNGRSFRQWYVNTGGWQPVSLADQPDGWADSRLSFLRIVPDRDNADRDLPELLEWRPSERKPTRLKIYSDTPC